MYRFTLSRIKSKYFFWSADYFGGVGLVGRVGCVGRIFSGKYLYSKKIADISASDLFGDPSAVTKFFIVSCTTESYEMCFCGTVPQIVVHFDLSGSKCGTKTTSF